MILDTIWYNVVIHALKLTVPGKQPGIILAKVKGPASAIYDVLYSRPLVGPKFWNFKAITGRIHILQINWESGSHCGRGMMNIKLTWIWLNALEYHLYEIPLCHWVLLDYQITMRCPRISAYMHKIYIVRQWPICTCGWSRRLDLPKSSQLSVYMHRSHRYESGIPHFIATATRNFRLRWRMCKRLPDSKDQTIRKTARQDRNHWDASAENGECDPWLDHSTGGAL